MTNISLFIKGKATEFDISQFSASFLGPEMTFEDMLDLTPRIFTRSMQKECHQRVKIKEKEREQKLRNKTRM